MPPKKAETGAPGVSGGVGEEAKEDLAAKEAPVAVVSKETLAALGEEVAAPAGVALAAAVALAARAGRTSRAVEEARVERVSVGDNGTAGDGGRGGGDAGAFS